MRSNLVTLSIVVFVAIATHLEWSHADQRTKCKRVGGAVLYAFEAMTILQAHSESLKEVQIPAPELGQKVFQRYITEIDSTVNLLQRHIESASDKHEVECIS